MELKWTNAGRSGYRAELWTLYDNGIDVKDLVIEPRVVTTDGMMELVISIDRDIERLIVAAPAMLEALEEIVSKDGGSTMCRELQKIAKQALSKAKGIDND